jgi:hypothetical protein
MKDVISNACAAVAQRLRNRARGRPRNRALPDPPGAATKRWAVGWAGPDSTADAVIRDWKAGIARAGPSRSNRQVPADQAQFTAAAVLRKHKGLHKHESSLLTQIRTGKIGLRAFLFDRGVPTVPTPVCSCGSGRETAAHLILWCPDFEEARGRLRARLLTPLFTERDLTGTTERSHSARIIVKWLLSLGIPLEYRLATQLFGTDPDGGLAGPNGPYGLAGPDPGGESGAEDHTEHGQDWDGQGDREG